MEARQVKLAYERVSTDEQVTDGQHDRLVAAGAERFYIDQGQSGAKASRPELDRMMRELRPGDTVMAVRLDRLGRSVKNLIELVDRIEKAGADLLIIEQNIDTRTPMGKFIFHILAALGEMERDLIRARTLDGLAAARARGNLGGRPKSYAPETATAVLALQAAGQSMADIATVCKISRRTAYRIVEDATTVV
jgi:DNA invertase Pin-like site-specific DNA recombinase